MMDHISSTVYQNISIREIMSKVTITRAIMKIVQRIRCATHTAAVAATTSIYIHF